MQGNLTEAEEDDLPTMAFVDFYDYGDYEAYEVSFAAYKLEYIEVGAHPSVLLSDPVDSDCVKLSA